MAILPSREISALARIYIIRVFDAAGRLVASQETQAGSGVTGGGPLRIAAGAGYRLEVVDPLSGAAPRKLLGRRNGSSTPGRGMR